MEKITIYLVDDHQVLIDGISLLLTNEPNINIVGSNTNPLIAFEEIKKLNPQIVLTDIQMPEITGIELALKLKNHNQNIAIIALSMYGSYFYVNEMKKAGANGYILKNCNKTELIKAINEVHTNGHYYNQDVLNELKAGEENQPKLTLRETEIIQLIAKEYNNVKIAQSLFISERTVETHRKNIFRKTNTKSVLGLIKFATTYNFL